MSFFGRVLLTAAVVAGVVHVFRRDIGRILGALQKPTEKFIKEVQKELDVQKASGALGASSGAGSGLGATAEAAAKAAAGLEAAAEVRQAASAAAAVAPPPAGAAAPVEGEGAATKSSELR